MLFASVTSPKYTILHCLSPSIYLRAILIPIEPSHSFEQLCNVNGYTIFYVAIHLLMDFLRFFTIFYHCKDAELPLNL